MKGYESCVVVTKAKNSKENLCDTCWFCIADCKQTQVKFGDGQGSDNIIVCNAYAAKNNEESLCKSCKAILERCDDVKIKFGNGICDVIECSGYIPAVEEKRIPSFVFCALWVALIIAIFAYIFF